MQSQYRDTPSQLKMFSKLAKLRRRDETLMHGATSIGGLVSHGFTLSRFQLHEHNETSGNVHIHISSLKSFLISLQVYVVAINLGKAELRLPLSDIPTIWTTKTRSAQVVAVSSNVNIYTVRQMIDIGSDKVVLIGGEQGIVLRFV